MTSIPSRMGKISQCVFRVCLRGALSLPTSLCPFGPSRPSTFYFKPIVLLSLMIQPTPSKIPLDPPAKGVLALPTGLPKQGVCRLSSFECRLMLSSLVLQESRAWALVPKMEGKIDALHPLWSLTTQHNIS